MRAFLVPFTLLALAVVVVTGAALGACRDSTTGDSGVPVSGVPGGVAPAAGFASGTVMAVSSEMTPTMLALLSVNDATGELGLLPGSPLDVGTPVGDVETLRVSTTAGRIYLGSGGFEGAQPNGLIAAVNVNPDGTLTPVVGSPFAAAFQACTALILSPNESFLYVGYENVSQVSQIPIDPTTGALGAPTQIPILGEHVETMLIVGGFLYIGCRNTSNITALAIDPTTDALSNPAMAINQAVLTRPDYLQSVNGRLYCTLSTTGAVDAYDVDPTTGQLTQLAGAPFSFPGTQLFELCEIDPTGTFMAVGVELPSSRIALFTIEVDGSLTPTGTPDILSPLGGGPEGMEWSADGRFLYIAEHIAQGIFVLELVGNDLVPASIPRYRLPGRQVDLILFPFNVTPP